MKITLLQHTPNALDLLLYTKNTRLQMTGGGLEEVASWPLDKKLAELRYMRNTIQSSWEFVDYTFALEGVTRAFCMQLIRHRVGTSFAQQSQRAVDMSGFDYLATGDVTRHAENRQEVHHTGDEAYVLDEERTNARPVAYHDVMEVINWGYATMLDLGIKPQDARGVLPTNILTNIVFKANLRTLHEMALKRLCVRAQGEFQDVFRAMVEAVQTVHPWAEDFLRVQCAWSGTCLFPLLPLDQCDVKRHVYDPGAARSYGDAQQLPGDNHLMTREQIYQLHRQYRGEAQPRLAPVAEIAHS